MNRRARNVILTWLALMLLGAIGFGFAFMPMGHGWRVVLILPSVAMAAIIAMGFMEVRRGGALSLAFSLAALFWLCVLLGLASMDPLTRNVYPAGPTVPD